MANEGWWANKAIKKPEAVPGMYTVEFTKFTKPRLGFRVIPSTKHETKVIRSCSCTTIARASALTSTIKTMSPPAPSPLSVGWQ